MSSIQVKVALRKEAKPELYCPWPKCLWETGDGSLCPRHGNGARAQRDPHMQEIGRSYEKGAP